MHCHVIDVYQYNYICTHTYTGRCFGLAFYDFVIKEYLIDEDMARFVYRLFIKCTMYRDLKKGLL